MTKSPKNISQFFETSESDDIVNILIDSALRSINITSSDTSI